MTNLITELSKYLFAFLAAGYAYFSFYYYRFKTEKAKKHVTKAQAVIMYLFHALAFLVIYLHTEEVNILIFYGVQLFTFLLYRFLYKKLCRHASLLLLNHCCMLFAIGMVILTRLSFEQATRQFLLFVLGAAVTILIPLLIKYWHWITRLTWLYAVFGIGALLCVMFLGEETYGAQLSLTFGGFAIQPSELVKITFVLFLAGMFREKPSFGKVVLTTLVAAAHVLILVASRDLGSALILFLSYLFVLFVATGKALYLFGGLLCGSAASVVAYYGFSHVQTRVAVWMDPWSDMANTGYQIVQSLFAIGTGGFIGSGLYQGMPYSIPVVRKDFIFAGIAEEFGSFFAICLLCIYLGCVLEFAWVSAREKDPYYKIAAFGLTAILAAQIFINVGGVIKLIPSTGITLPLISYGGSSLLTTLIMFGMIQGLHEKKFMRNESIEK